MRRALTIVFCIAVATIATAAPTFAAVPSLMTVQGKLTDAGGAPLAGSHDLAFRIFDAAAAGNQVWPGGGAPEIQTLAASADGLWITNLGVNIPLTDGVFSDSVRWLEVTVDGNTLPRIRLITGPFAFRVATVDGASGGTITSKVSIGTGHTNTGQHAFVSGQANSVSNTAATVSGGVSNEASGAHAFVGAGQGNTASGFNTVIGGGTSNSALADNSLVSGGSVNTASGSASVVVGGERNKARGNFSFIGGGGGGSNSDSNSALGALSTIGGGRRNIASGDSSAILGGTGNIASGLGSVVGGGKWNRARGEFSVVVGGGGVTASDSNVASGIEGFIGGGRQNLASGQRSSIVGGEVNLASGAQSVVVGGSSNAATASATFVGGGGVNIASRTGACVVGGESNTASGIRSFVGGGLFNFARGDQSVVTGGGGVGIADSNSATGIASVIPGGRRNVASGDFSLAAGLRAKANHLGSFVWGDSSNVDATSDKDNQFKIRAKGGVMMSEYAPATGMQIGERYRDNGIVAWGSVSAAGVDQGSMGLTSISHVNGTGLYTITVDVTAGSAATLLMVAVCEVDAVPTSAATARIAYIDQVSANSFNIYTTNGSWAATDNQFSFIVTAR